MKKTWLLCTVLPLLAGEFPADAAEDNPSGTRTLRFVQDDAQDYMVSKIYILKYTQANALMPWVLSIVKRFNIHYAVTCID